MEAKLPFQPIHVLRGLQAFLAILTLGLLAHVAHWYNSTIMSMPSTPAMHVPNEIAYAIFVSVMTILITLPYVLLTPRFFPHLFKSHTKYTVLVLESLSMILWFAAFVSVAAFIGKLEVCRGGICTCAKAGAGVAAIAWLSWGVTSIFALRFCLGSGVIGDSEGISKVERTREKMLRGLRLHNVWTGHGRREEEQKTSDGFPEHGWAGNSGDNRF